MNNGASLRLIVYNFALFLSFPLLLVAFGVALCRLMVYNARTACKSGVFSHVSPGGFFMHNSKVYDGSPELLTTAEVARLLNVSLTTVRNLVARDKIPSLKIGKNRRFVAGYIYDWIYDNQFAQKLKMETDDDAA